MEAGPKSSGPAYDALAVLVVGLVGTGYRLVLVAGYLDRPPRSLADLIRRGDQQAVDKARPRRLAEEGVNVGLLDRVDGVVRLCLDRPQAAVVFLGD